jgi:ABC-type glycerol-3-phosphate transport system permease component
MTGRQPLPLRITSRGLLALWVFLAAFPFFWMFLISLRAPVDAFTFPPKLLAPVTFEHFYSVWVRDGFWRHAINSAVVTFGTVTVSLAIGCVAGYALSRYRGALGFWLLIIALVFRAMPHVVLLTAYKPAFLELGVWSRYETLIVVLVAINQPFTIWMLRSFFMNIPQELDEAALVDGCSRLEAFVRVIMPVMWPGVITTGLFSFLLAYNDYLISSQLMNGEMMTMTSTLGNYTTSDENLTRVMEGIAGAVSVTAPLIVLVLIFQRQIVSGLTQGAVKG